MTMKALVRDEGTRPSRARGEAKAPEPAAHPDLQPAAALFHSLSDPTRLTIVQHLTAGEHRVRDLTEHLGLAQSTVSAHLACLKGCGLVDSRPQGRASLYFLTTDRALLSLLSAAEELLAATGYAVTLCPTNTAEAR
ncbi:ArsR family transcriptional regulator [Georgenia soli]|uniref:ArsR family transcriptional regulator n=1 Tax=Georgenia soli TaxID=638953 RepID=A0A2A9EMY3_9MICO|nr:metalloregulator ArsR/SmtB family transcription factor [Georgenia soli]PFG39612.1 ArsR family transcriptional regulator [Georgenia soli]